MFSGPHVHQFYFLYYMVQGYKMRTILLCLAILLVTCAAQFAPSWTTSAFMQTKSFSVVSGIQKTSGVFPTTITFSGTFTTPSLALSIPQLRIVSNNHVMNFKCLYSALSPTSFVNKLTIQGNDTVIWYLVQRYFVISWANLPNTFQAGIYDANPTILSSTARTSTSENFTNTTQYPFSFTLTTPVCVPFLVGVTANSSIFYQLNLTCAFTGNNSFNITGVVHPSTYILSLTVYIITYDTTYLSSKYIYFVDYAKTTTYLGTQTVFASLPFGYYDSNFIGGLSSFSMQDNIEFNATLAIPTSNAIYTSSTSMYDSIPQVQIRVRNCPPAYPNYNIVDGLCYTICPSTTYLISTNFLCSPCGSFCANCTSNLTCTVCISPMILQSGVCTCPTSSYLFNGVCYGCDYTCQTCTSTGQYYNCLSCNYTNNRTEVNVTSYNKSCPCKTGFYDAGIPLCAEICGDGQAIIDECDDGNTIDGDGCSSSCKIQTYFICPKDSFTLFSTCFFVGNISISVAYIYKDPFANSVQFYIQVSPWIDLMTQLGDPDYCALDSNGSFISTECTTYDGLDITSNINLVYTVYYSQAMDDTYLRINLKAPASGVFSKMPPANVTVKCVSDNGFEMIVYSDNDYTVAAGFHYACTVLGYFMLASAPLYIFGRLKWVGNMLFLSLQFQYLNIVILDRFTPMIEGLSWFKYLTGYNELNGLRSYDKFKYKSFLLLGYNLSFENNVNFMVAFQVLGIVMYIVYYIFWRKNELVCKKFGGDPQKTFNATKWGKFLNFFNWEFFMFWNFFNMTNEILSIIICSQVQLNPSIIPLQIFCVVCIFLAILPLFIKRKQVPSYTELLYFKTRGREQQLVTLGGFVLLYIFFYLARSQIFLIYYMAMLVPVLLIIYMICRRPFQSKWVRAAYIINNACILISLIYHRIGLDSKNNTLYLPFGPFIIILFDWIFNLVVWGRQAYIICKYGGQEGLNQLFDTKSKTSNYQSSQPSEILKTGKQQLQNTSLLSNVLKKNDNKFDKTLRTKRQKKVDDSDMPQNLGEQKRKMIEEQKEEERKDLENRRKKWSKEMQQMQEIRELRERTRSALLKSRASHTSINKRQIPTTKQKGVDESRMSQIDNQKFKLSQTK